MKTEELKISLTQMEAKVMKALKDDEAWYNWGSEPGYSDVDINDLVKYTKIPATKLRGVLSSLTKKKLIHVEDVRGQGLAIDQIIYPTFNTYVAYDEVTEYVDDALGWTVRA